MKEKKKEKKKRTQSANNNPIITSIRTTQPPMLAISIHMAKHATATTYFGHFGRASTP